MKEKKIKTSMVLGIAYFLVFLGFIAYVQTNQVSIIKASPIEGLEMIVFPYLLFSISVISYFALRGKPKQSIFLVLVLFFSLSLFPNLVYKSTWRGGYDTQYSLLLCQKILVEGHIRENYPYGRTTYYSQFPLGNIWISTTSLIIGIDVELVMKYAFSVISSILMPLSLFILYRVTLKEEPSVTLSCILVLFSNMFVWTSSYFSGKAFSFQFVLIIMYLLLARVNQYRQRIFLVVSLSFAAIASSFFENFVLLVLLLSLALADLVARGWTKRLKSSNLTLMALVLTFSWGIYVAWSTYNTAVFVLRERLLTREILMEQTALKVSFGSDVSAQIILGYVALAVLILPGYIRDLYHVSRSMIRRENIKHVKPLFPFLSCTIFGFIIIFQFLALGYTRAHFIDPLRYWHALALFGGILIPYALGKVIRIEGKARTDFVVVVVVLTMFITANFMSVYPYWGKQKDRDNVYSVYQYLVGSWLVKNTPSPPSLYIYGYEYEWFVNIAAKMTKEDIVPPYANPTSDQDLFRYAPMLSNETMQLKGFLVITDHGILTLESSLSMAQFTGGKTVDAEKLIRSLQERYNLIYNLGESYVFVSSP